ncbi:hypothetical protein AGMMS50212_17180 [Spirochaetia bacterium]|nr:hypothetical protein AGMMS50212_17180 [Spirochaetia bacterium]
MKTIQDILRSLEKKDIDCNEAEKKISALYNSDLGFAQLDIKRQERTGYPEVVFCAGKTIAQSLSFVCRK